MTCRVQLLGAPSIWTPVGQLTPAKPLVFAATLYLALNRGHEVRRTELSALLWPDADDAVRSERSRWLVHQLRQAGLVAEARTPHIALNADVALDIDALVDAASAADALALTRGDVLAGYEPHISDTFSRWVDATRDATRSKVIRVLDSWLATARRTASWPLAEELARRIIALDELHEGAGSALAESLALMRQLPSRHHATTPRSTLAGRKEVLATLLDVIDASRQASRRVGIAGPSGIGKSRLLDEVISLAQFRGTRVAHIRCGGADALRPLSLVSDIARALLDVRGALGASPTSIETLRSFLGQQASEREDLTNEARRAAVYAALCDVVGALSDDGPLVIVIDDAQWAEPGSWAILGPLFSQPTTATLSWIIALRAEAQESVGRTFATIFPPQGLVSDQYQDSIWLTPLDHEDVATLCAARAAPRQVPSEVLDLLISRAGGIPFIAEALVDHWMEGGDLSLLPPSVARLVSARLDRLSPDVVAVLETIAVLGPYAQLDGLEAVCLLERGGVLDATRELETAGILRSEQGRLSAHALWTEAVLARAPRTTIQVLHRYAAQWLEHHTTVFKSTDHRRHWAVATHWLEAGDPERGLRALNRAAEVLLASGFPAEAAKMLERCAEIVGVSDATLQYWKRAVELWSNDASTDGYRAILRIHAQYDRVGRALDPSFSPHHDVEALANRAFSNQNVPQRDKLQRYLSCAASVAASLSHRLAATTHVILLYGNSGLDRTTVDAAFAAVAKISPATTRERLEVELCAAQYFSRVGDSPAKGIEHALRARQIVDDPHFGDFDFRRVMLTLADCLEFADDLDRAQAARRELYERGKQRRSRFMMIYALEGLISQPLEAGRPAEARPLLELLGRPAAGSQSELDLGRTIYWVVCALEEGNAIQARADMGISLTDADSAPGAMARARLLAIYAHLALLEGDDVTVLQLMPRLLECFSGRMGFMHHPAYVTALCLRRYRGAAAAADFVRRFLDEITIDRWTPRIELLRMARGEDPHVTDVDAPPPSPLP